MSDKIKKLLLRKERELDINNSFYDKDEVNYKYINDIKNINSVTDNDNTSDLNKNNEESYKNNTSEDYKKYIFNEENNKANLEMATETEENNNINIEQEDELPLITLNFISNCQCCKNKFDKEKCLPYLFKCGHFFCINCIKQYFTDKTGIICPLDGLVAKSVNELILLKNLIIDTKKKANNLKENKKKIEKNNFITIDKDKNFISDNINSNRMNYCPIHINQKLSHIVCDTNEVICVHCAFDRLKSNPNDQIIEIKEKYNEFCNIIENIINNSQKNIDLINSTLGLINKNKENEIKKLNIFYNNIIKFVEEERRLKTQQIENISNENIHDLEQKLLIFNEIIEQGEELQKSFEKEDSDTKYSSLLYNFNSILNLNKSNNEDNINNKLKYIKFFNENELNIKEYLSKISNLTIIFRIIKYIKNNKASKDNNNSALIKLDNKIDISNYSSIQNHKINPIRKLDLNINYKNISCEKINENNINNNYNTNFKTKSNYNNIKQINPIYRNNYNNHQIIRINKLKNTISNSTKNKNRKNLNKSSFLKQKIEDRYINKNSIRNKIHNSLLDSYFEIKNKEKSCSLNYYDNLDDKNENHKNCKSFNNLNILNNFYNLNYNKKSPNINNQKKKSFIANINRNKYIDKDKLYNDTLNRLIPEKFKKYNNLFNFK